MRELTGLDMLHIDVANCYGQDKEEWIDRLLWTQCNIDNLRDLKSKADEPLLYEKAVLALEEVQQRHPVGHNMFLDATSSGYQIMAALSGCKVTGANTNMVYNGKRNDLYLKMATTMNGIIPDTADRITRAIIKHPTMTTAYNSKKQPETVFGKNTPELYAFHDTLATEVPGALVVMDTINQYWDNSATEHTWTLPDGHVSRVLVTDVVTARIEVDELNHTKFSHRFEAIMPSDHGVSLVANIVQSVESYIVREMIRMAKSQGFELAHIFDAFTALPNHMTKVMQNYRVIMAKIADSNLLADILSEISGTNVCFVKMSTDLSKDILASQYMLS